MTKTEVELENTRNEVVALETEIVALLDAIADAERRNLELEAAVNRARSAYENAHSQYTTAVNVIQRESYTLTTISGPWASTQSVGSGRTRTMALAAILAGLTSVFGLLFVDYMRSNSPSMMQPSTDAFTRRL